MEQLRYPVGRFQIPPTAVNEQDRESLIESLASLPAALRATVAGASEPALETHYRPGGWTVRQLVHHIADSHMNAYIRCKFALSEDEPVIKPYEEKIWAETAEAAALQVAPSLSILDGLHARWAAMFRALSAAQFTRAYRHPEMGLVRLDVALALYEWHGRHHLAHISRARAAVDHDS